MQRVKNVIFFCGLSAIGILLASVIQISVDVLRYYATPQVMLQVAASLILVVQSTYLVIQAFSVKNELSKLKDIAFADDILRRAGLQELESVKNHIADIEKKV